MASLGDSSAIELIVGLRARRMDRYASLAEGGIASPLSLVLVVTLSRETGGRSVTAYMLLDPREDRVLDLLGGPEVEEFDEAVEAWRRGLGELTG